MILYASKYTVLMRVVNLFVDLTISMIDDFALVLNRCWPVYQDYEEDRIPDCFPAKVDVYEVRVNQSCSRESARMISCYFKILLGCVFRKGRVDSNSPFFGCK